MLSTKINIGELDRRVIILSPIISTGVNRPLTNEDEITGWQELDEVWGKVTPFKGNEAMIAERLTETHHVEVTIRYRSDVTTRMRLVLSGRVYDVVSITETTDRQRMMTVIAELNDKEIWS